MGVGLGLERSRAAAPAGPTIGPDLVTNGGFDVDASWTKTSATISGGKLHFTVYTQGDNQSATQTLAGGSVPAGVYRVTLDLTVIISQLGTGTQIQLLGAANEVRGFANFPSSGLAQTADITASGEVSKINIRGSSANGDDADIDNVKLQSVTP